MADISTNTVKNIVDLLKNGGLSAVLIFIMFYFGSIYVTKLETIEKDILSIKLELVKIQTKTIDRQLVQKIVDEKLRYYHQK